MPVINLPTQPTSFVGRENELAEITTLLADPACRLLTIVGAGGIGKTRLAIQSAVSQQPHFADGVHFVPLAPVASADLLPAAIAEALGISFFGSENPRIQTIRYLRETHMLLVMDNFEHLLEGTDLLTDLLQAAPNLKILVTSRERMNLQEEWVFALDGLSYPTESLADSLEHYSAIQLFVQRARQIQVPFSLNENRQAVQSICRQVEGMPLGLELAASWLRVMSCPQIVMQMAASLDFLRTPLRNVPERHRSLRVVFDQSWRLLSDDEQAVLMKLSVFRGGFNLDAAVCVADATLLLMASLVDKSLIRLNASKRYELHELFRQYAADQLLDAGMASVTIERHVTYFLNLAERAEAHLFGPEQIIWFDRLEIDMDNLRAAYARSTESEMGLRLAAALGWFFSEWTYWNEGLGWLEQTLATNPNSPVPLRAKALHRAGGLAGHLGDQRRLRMYCEEAIAISQPTHDDWNIAWALCHLGLYGDGDLKESATHLEESAALFRQLNDPMGLAHTLIRLSWIAIMQKNIPYARSIVDEVAVLILDTGDAIISGWVHVTMGRIAQTLHDFTQARNAFENGILFFDQARTIEGINLILISLAGVEMKLGSFERAQKLYKTALIKHRGRILLVNQSHMPSIFAGLATIAKSRGHFERAARLLAAANEDWLLQFEPLDAELNSYESDIVAVRAVMGEAAFAEAWAVGKAMTNGQAEAYALEDNTSFIDTTRTSHSADQPLTQRELEILRLTADGLNSREVAERLVLSVETIRWYLKLIYSKLDVHSRSEAIARAKALNLLV